MCFVSYEISLMCNKVKTTSVWILFIVAVCVFLLIIFIFFPVVTGWIYMALWDWV